MTESIKTWGELLSQYARNTPNKIAIISNSSEITYGELQARVNRLANAFLNQGITKGDKIAVLCDKSPEFIITFIACVKIGAILTPLNYRVPSNELEFVLKLTNPKILVADIDYLMNYYDVLEQYFPGNRRLILGPLRSFGLRWNDLLTAASNQEPPIQSTPEDVVYLNFTSGSTGTPKAALTTQSNLYWNTKAAVDTLGLHSDDIHLSMFPVYGHPHELWCRAIYLGGTMVLQDQLSPKSIARNMMEHGVTFFMAVPSLIDMLVSMIEDDKDEYDFSKLRMMEAGGMHATSGLTSRILNAFEKSNTLFLPVWGSTETAGIALASLIDGKRPVGSVGKPIQYYETRIVNENDQDCIPGETGELIVRGPGVVQGYLNNPEETNKSFRNGWYYTGDLMKKDEEGYYYFVYRRQGMMKVAGMKVSPQEIDNILSLHPKIKEAICIPSQDKLRGEIPKAIIVLNEDEQLTPQAVKKYCRSKLADYKVPRIIEFWAELPKTATGKIDLKKIKQLSESGIKVTKKNLSKESFIAS